MMKSQRRNTEEISLIEEGKKIGIDKIIKGNEMISNSFKVWNTQYRNLIVWSVKQQQQQQKSQHKNPNVSTTNNGKIMLISKCAICGSKKSRFIKK